MRSIGGQAPVKSTLTISAQAVPLRFDMTSRQLAPGGAIAGGWEPNKRLNKN